MNITQAHAQELLGALKEIVGLSRRHELGGTAYLIAIDRAHARAESAIKDAEAQKLSGHTNLSRSEPT